MSKILVVFGATGQQGGSVANFVLNDPDLSKEFKVRGITRQPSSDAAQKLKEAGAEIVYGDADDAESLKGALEDSHTVFILTTTIYDEDLEARERRQGKAIADAAVHAGAQYLIFSTLCSMDKLSGGKHQVISFDVKLDIENYIRSLPIKSAFFAPGGFMENFHTFMAPQPAPDGSGSYVMVNIVFPEAVFPFIAISLDTGKYVGAILADPAKFEGETLYAGAFPHNSQEIAEEVSRHTGKTVKYVQIPEERYRSFMPPIQGHTIPKMMLGIERYGYFGPETNQRVEWSAEQARGKLTTFREYLEQNPIKLE